MMVIVLAIVVLTPIMAIGARRMMQYRVSKRRRLTGPGSIEELSFWTIGGISQCVQIRGEDASNPLLVYLHGGPGFPMMPRAHAFQRHWEKDFTVVQWDQRLAGKTLTRIGVGDAPLSVEQFVTDGLELANQLRTRFPACPIVLLGHSWGTVLAIEMLRRAPNLFAAYVAIGQVSDFMESERYGYQIVLAEAKRRNAAGIVTALSSYPDYPENADFCAAAIKAVRSAYMKLGFGYRGSKRMLPHMLKLSFESPDYSWRDLLSLSNRKAQTASFALALRELPLFIGRVTGARVSCPVFMVGGRYDLFTPTPIARKFFETIEAPFKEFIEADGLAHAGPIENPAFFDALLHDRVLPMIAQPTPPKKARGNF